MKLEMAQMIMKTMKDTFIEMQRSDKSLNFETEIETLDICISILKLHDKMKEESMPIPAQWIPIGYDGYADGAPVWDEWKCSTCLEEHHGDQDTLTDYCPHCGAKMDGIFWAEEEADKESEK